MSEWIEYKLGDVCVRLSSGKSISLKDTSSVGDLPIFGGNGTRGYSHKSNFEGECAIIGRQGAYCGNVRYFKGKAYMTEHAVVLIANAENNTRFLSYFLSLQNLGNLSAQSAQPGISVKTLSEQKYLLPPITEQERIVGILSTLDDKIDLLNRQNQTLESMAETLFRHYFIDNSDENIEDVQLGEVVETMSGGTPFRKKSEYYTNGTIYWIKSKELIGTYIFETEEMITEEALNNSSAKYIPANSILIAMYGSNVGEYGITSKPMTCNQAVCALIPNNIYPFTYLYLWVKAMQPEFINLACGAAQQNISQIVIKQQYVCGDRECVSNFHNFIVHYFDKIKNNQAQILSLTKLRESLLPKLMSNEINLQL